MNHFREILNKLPDSISYELEQLPDSVIDRLEEVRLRVDQIVRLQCGDTEKLLSHAVTSEDLRKTLNNLIKFSYHTYEDDLAQGFITIEGGHRVGVCGKVVVKQGQPALIKEISSLNLRFAREIQGCSDQLWEQLLDASKRPENTLIVSPPGCGKTTLLRDLARNLSYHRIKVAICDERSELAGTCCGQASFDLGPRTDVLDGCDKADGIPMLIRSMSPQVIITDEIGKARDLEAVELCTSTGVSLITSIHGSSLEDLAASNLGPLVEKNIFKHLIFLEKGVRPGIIREVIHV